jgi:hypothetical protein
MPICITIWERGHLNLHTNHQEKVSPELHLHKIIMKYLKEFNHLDKEEINPVDLISSQKLNMQHSKKETNFLEKILLLDYKCEIFTNKF